MLKWAECFSFFIIHLPVEREYVTELLIVVIIKLLFIIVVIDIFIFYL